MEGEDDTGTMAEPLEIKQPEKSADVEATFVMSEKQEDLQPRTETSIEKPASIADAKSETKRAQSRGSVGAGGARGS